MTVPKMNPEVKAAWIDALLSGDYEQGKHRLRSINDTFCCLGVLCDLHAKATGKDWTRGNIIDCFQYLEADGSLPAPVADWAGVSSYGAYDDSHACSYTLTTLNDIDGYTFRQIADVIEKNL